MPVPEGKTLGDVFLVDANLQFHRCFHTQKRQTMHIHMYTCLGGRRRTSLSLANPNTPNTSRTSCTQHTHTQNTHIHTHMAFMIPHPPRPRPSIVPFPTFQWIVPILGLVVAVVPADVVVAVDVVLDLIALGSASLLATPLHMMGISNLFRRSVPVGWFHSE